VALFVLLNRRTHNREGGAITLFFLKICAASAAVAYVCHRLQLFLEPHFAWHTMPGAFAMLLIVTCVGIVLLFIVAKLLGIREFDELVARVRGMLTRGGTDALPPAAPEQP
jgi:predicted PurR-regulated permease PerM